MGKKEDVMAYLNEKVFDPALHSNKTSGLLKQAIRVGLMRMHNKDAEAIVEYYLSTMIGKDKPTKFSEMMKEQGDGNFDAINEEFRKKFGGS